MIPKLLMIQKKIQEVLEMHTSSGSSSEVSHSSPVIPLIPPITFPIKHNIIQISLRLQTH